MRILTDSIDHARVLQFYNGVHISAPYFIYCRAWNTNPPVRFLIDPARWKRSAKCCWSNKRKFASPKSVLRDT
jgi:hypothetical protein